MIKKLELLKLDSGWTPPNIARNHGGQSPLDEFHGKTDWDAP
jgi:hypothetical protein